MPAISFSAREILGSLLDKSKVQTIRPLFCGLTYCGKDIDHKHKPRLKAYDVVTLYWKMRGKAKEFCLACGTGMVIGAGIGPFCPLKDCSNGDGPTFPKKLGTVLITEVIEIEMDEDGIVYNMKDGRIDLDDLMKRDGFPSWLTGSQWFHTKYDLSTRKRFAVYRWKWLKERKEGEVPDHICKCALKPHEQYPKYHVGVCEECGDKLICKVLIKLKNGSEIRSGGEELRSFKPPMVSS